MVDLVGWLKREFEIVMKIVRREVEEDKFFVVIDFVDLRRNVVVNLSWEKYGRFYFKVDEFF